MASLNCDMGDVSKMKVAELKKELKARGLSTVGSKTELVERLQSAGNQNAQDAMSEDGNVESEMLDEDEVLAGVEGAAEFDDEDAEAVLADEPKIKRQAESASQKRTASQETQPKKRILVRPTSVTTASEKENGSEEKNTQMETDESKPDSNEKKIVKLSTVSLKERLALRAQKFGLPLSDSAKKQARAERFGSTPSAGKPIVITGATKITLIAPTEEVLKKRAARFGGNVSSTAIKAEETDKLKKRQERFGLNSAASIGSLDEKKKLRAERFQL